MKRGETGLCGLIAIDKPAGITSHDVIDRVRRIYGERRCGHVGTLDPAATGLLVVAVGPATRLCPYLSARRKGYLARIAFGQLTDTDDAEGRVLRQRAVPEQVSDRAYAAGLLEEFTGHIEQRPPAYSAIKQGGKKAYEAAREGDPLLLAPRPVTVFSADLVRVGECPILPLDEADDVSAVQDGTDASPAQSASCDTALLPQGAAEGAENSLPQTVCWDVGFEVSKGTYIRSLARDLGHAAGTCAHLQALRRTSIGDISVSAAYRLEQLEGLSFEEACLDPVELLGYHAYVLADDDVKKVSSGGKLSLGLGFQGELVSLVGQDRLLALYERTETCYRPKVVIAGGVYRGKQ